MEKEKAGRLVDAIKLEKSKARSAWRRGVCDYALDFIDNLSWENAEEITRDVLLNGAENWFQYSWGVCSLIYDEDICERLCNNTEKKRTKNGKLRPNRDEKWLDVQARALSQACAMVLRLSKNM